MAEENTNVQQSTDPPTDKIKAIYTTLKKDQKYSSHLPDSQEAFALKLQDPKIADAVYQTLLKDQKYSSHLPDSTGWANIFAASQPDPDKKKEETGLPDSSTGSQKPLPESIAAPAPEEFPAPSSKLPVPQGNKLAQTPDKVEKLIEEADFGQLQEKFEKQLAIRKGEVMDSIVTDIQAELDAGNINEEEANAMLDSQFTAAETKLIDEIEPSYQSELDSLNEAYVKQQTDLLKAEQTAQQKAEAEAGENAIVGVPNILGAITGTQPVKYKPAKALSAFERGLLTGAAMIKSIPDNLGLTYNTGVIEGSNDVLAQLEGKSDDEEVAGYNVGELRKAVQGEKSKAIKEGVEQYNRSSEKLKKYQWGSDVPQDTEDIKSFEDFGKFAAFTIGQAAPQALGAIVATGATVVNPVLGGAAMTTVGLGTMSLETGIIQLEQVDRVAAETGMTPEEILEQALVDPQASVLGGVIAGSLDMISLGVVLKSTGLTTLSRKFIQKGAKEILKKTTKKSLVKELTKGVLVATLSEGITEPTQGVIESTAAIMGTHPEKSLGGAIKEGFEWKKFKTEALAGSIMGFSFAGMGLTSKSAQIQQSIEKAVLERAVKKREAEISNIREGSTMTLQKKDGTDYKLKNIEGKWRVQNKNGRWRTLRLEDQVKANTAYVSKQKEKTEGEIVAEKLRAAKKETTPVVKEEVKSEPVKEETPAVKQEEAVEEKVPQKQKESPKKVKSEPVKEEPTKEPEAELEAYEKVELEEGKSKVVDKTDELSNPTHGTLVDGERIYLQRVEGNEFDQWYRVSKKKGGTTFDIVNPDGAEVADATLNADFLGFTKKEAIEKLQSIAKKSVKTPPITKVKQKAEPKVEPKVKQKAEPKVEPKVKQKAEPKVEPKAEPKVEQKVEPKVEPKKGLKVVKKKIPILKRGTPIIKNEISEAKRQSNTSAELVGNAKSRGLILNNGNVAKDLRKFKKAGITRDSIISLLATHNTNLSKVAKLEAELTKSQTAVKSEPKKQAPLTIQQQLDNVRAKIRQVSGILNQPQNRPKRAGTERVSPVKAAEDVKVGDTIAGGNGFKISEIVEQKTQRVFKGAKKGQVVKVKRKDGKVSLRRKSTRGLIVPKINQLTELKAQRDALKAQLGKGGAIQEQLASVDPNATATPKGKPVKDNGLTQEEWDFEARGIEGTLTIVSGQGLPPIYYAVSKEADSQGRPKYVTIGSESAADAVRDLRNQKPRNLTQTGAPHLEVLGEPLNSNPKKKSILTKLTEALNTAELLVRTEILPIEPRKEGQKVGLRRMKLFLEKGHLTTIFVTTRGKPHAIGKKGGKAEGKPIDISNDKQLRAYPEILALLKKPELAKKTTNHHKKQDPDVKHDETDNKKYTEKTRDFGKKIRGKKIKVPKGALKTVGFDDVWNGALDAAALVMETGGQVVDAFRAAMKHIRSSEWYKSLSPTDQAINDRILQRAIEAEYEKAGVPLNGKLIEKAVELDKKQMLRENKHLRKSATERLIFDRRMAINLGAYRTRLFIEALNTELPNKLDRELIPFILEKTGVPENLNRPDLHERWANRDVKKLDEVAKKVKERFDKVWEIMTQNKEDMTENYVDDYVTHIWDIKKNEKTDVINHFVSKNRWASGRYIKTLEEGINIFKMQPKMLDISQILSIHGSYATNVEANIEMLKALKALKINGVHVVVHTSNKKQDGTATWVKLPWNEMMNFKVHPDVAEALKPVMLYARENGKLLNALEKGNALLKGMQLTISLFHHGALIEAALPLIGAKIVPAIFRETLYRGALKAQAKITGNTSWAQLPYAFQKSALAEDAISHGTQLGATMDIRIKEMETFFSSIRKLAEKGGDIVAGKEGKAVAGLLPKVAEGVIGANNALLWDYLHDNLKLMAYESLVAKIPEKYNTPELIRKYKIEQAQFVNDSFGGQNWDVLGYSPSELKMARWFLLSPDWTLSTIRQAAPFVLGIPRWIAKNTGYDETAWKISQFAGGRFEETQGVRANTATKFWLKAIAIYAIGYSMLNAWHRKKDIEENPKRYTKWERENPWLAGGMWNNTVGHKTHVMAGRNPDGSERYLRVGKQFRELPEFFLNKDDPEVSVSVPLPAIHKIGGKLSPLLQLALVSFTGKTGSGFENWLLKDKTSWDWTKQYVKVLALGLSPFALNTMWRPDREFKASDLVFPSSKGMSNFKAIKILQYYMWKGDWESQKKILLHANRNNLNPWKVYSLALGSFKSDITTEMKSAYEERDQVLLALDNPSLTPMEVKGLQGKLKDIEQDIWEREYAWDMIIKSNGRWAEFELESTGQLSDKTLEEFFKTIENRELGF